MRNKNKTENALTSTLSEIRIFSMPVSPNNLLQDLRLTMSPFKFK